MRRTKIYAIIETGGKQYKVSPGETIDVEHLPIQEGKTIELSKVLLLADGDNVTVGTPVVDGARIMATSQGELKGDKVIVLKYKRKVHYRNKTGHRQIHTRLMIDRILKPGETVTVPKRTRRTKKVAPKEDTSPVETPHAEVPAEVIKEETSSGT